MLVVYVWLRRWFWFFFFQAEDGIRAADVTGVQTCALPICPAVRFGPPRDARPLAGSAGEPLGLPARAGAHPDGPNPAGTGPGAGVAARRSGRAEPPGCHRRDPEHGRPDS